MFNKKLKELREKNNLSMDKLVELYNNKYNAKMNKSTLSRYENGLQDPIYTVVVNLADFFSVTVDYIIGSEEENSEQSTQGELSEVKRALITLVESLSESEAAVLLASLKSGLGK